MSTRLTTQSGVIKLRKIIARLVTYTPVPEILVRKHALKHLTIVGYHRILPLPDKDYPFNEELISATPEEFTRELRYYQRHLDVISMAELHAGLEGRAPLPERPAVITFDDGYFDNHQIALPILREVGLPACFFVATGLIGTCTIPWYEQMVCCLKYSHTDRIESPFGEHDPPYFLDTDDHKRASICRYRKHLRCIPWSAVHSYVDALRHATHVDPEEYHDRPLFMSWNEIRELDAAGMDVGGHTCNHAILSNVDDPETLREEILGCHIDLCRELGRAPIAFAYPVGTAETMSITADDEIQRAGFKLTFSYLNKYPSKRLENYHRIPRIQTEYGNDFPSFRFGLARATIV